MTAAGPRPLLGFLPWLLASLAAHALVLMQWPQAGAPTTIEEISGNAPLQLRLMRSSESAQGSAARIEQASATPIRDPETAPAQPHVTAVARAAVPRTQSLRAPARMAAATAAAPQTRATTGPGADTAHSAGATAVTGGEAMSSSDSAGWSELMSLLHAAIDRHKRYPQSALSMGREGSARVDFRLRPDGHIEEVNIGVSSGVRALDLAAYRAVQAIAPFAHAGRYLDSTQRFQVDVVFRIN